jgi:hypothetical protein
MSLAKIARIAKEEKSETGNRKSELADQSIGLMAAVIDGSTRSWKSGPLSRT